MNEHHLKSASKKAVVRIGRLSVEPDVPAALTLAGVTVGELIERHRAGDWGMVDDDWEEERLDEAARQGGTVTSVYYLDTGDFVWVTTEAGITYVILAPNIHRG